MLLESFCWQQCRLSGHSFDEKGVQHVSLNSSMSADTDRAHGIIAIYPNAVCVHGEGQMAYKIDLV